MKAWVIVYDAKEHSHRNPDGSVKPLYWSPPDTRDGDWSSDPLDACRFAREIDAQNVCKRWSLSHTAEEWVFDE